MVPITASASSSLKKWKPARGRPSNTCAQTTSRATTRTAALALAEARAGFTTAEHAARVRHITGRDGYTTRQFLAEVRNSHSGRKLTVLTSIDRDYQNLRTGMQALSQHIGIGTDPAAA